MLSTLRAPSTCGLFKESTFLAVGADGRAPGQGVEGQARKPRLVRLERVVLDDALVDRRLHTAEVAGSIPASPTSENS